MPIYKVTDPDTNQTLELTGESPPTEQELESIFSEYKATEQVAKPQQITQKPTATVEQVFAGMFGEGKVGQIAERLTVDALISPLTEVSRGLYKHTAGFYEKADAVQQLIEKIPLVPDVPDVFANWASQLTETAEDIPETQMAQPTKTIYELIGGTIPIVTGFATAKSALGLAKVPQILEARKLGQLTQVGEFALVSALDAYAENPETASLAEGAREGAIIAMSFPIAFKGLGLLKNFGKGVAEKFIHFVTGSTRLAKDFVKDPRKYNLNPLGKVKTGEEVALANKAVRLRLKNEHTAKMNIYKTRVSRENELLNIKLKDTKVQTVKRLDEARESLRIGSQTKLDDLSVSVTKTIDNNNKVIGETLVKTYDDSLAKYQLLKKNAGKNVETAINSTLERNPGAGITTNIIKKKWDIAVKKFSPFKITAKQRAIPKSLTPGGGTALKPEVTAQFEQALGKEPVSAQARTAAASQSDAKVFDAVLQEFNSMAKQKQLPLGYLQNLKKDIKRLSQKAYSTGNSELGLFYSELSKSVDIAKTISSNPALSKNLKEIAVANKEFSEFLPKYEEALRQFYKKNSQGGYAPDVNKAVKAVRGQDKAALKEMVKADSALPLEDRILPKVNKIVKESDALEQQQHNLIKSLRAKAKQEQFKLQQASKATIANLQKEQGAIRYENKEKTLAQVNEFVNKKNTEYEAVIDNLNKAEEFYKNQDKIRSLRAGNETLARLMQNIAGFSAAASAKFGNVPTTAGALGAASMLAPVAAAGLVKSAVQGIGPGYRLLRELLESETARRIIAGEIIEVSKKK